MKEKVKEARPILERVGSPAPERKREFRKSLLRSRDC